MKFLVFGAGSLGTLLGAHLARQYNVHLVGRTPHVQEVARNGVRVTGSRDFHVACDASTEAPPHWIPDVVLIAVKAFDREAAVEGLAGRLGPRTTVVTVQNGLGNWERYQDAFAEQTVLAASVIYGARLEAPGRVVATGDPEIIVGGRPDDADVADALAEAFALASLPTKAVQDVRGVLLGKALVNAAINPLTAVAGVANEALLTNKELHKRLVRICDEGRRLIDAVEYDVPIEDLRARVEQVARNTGENHSSMLQDIEKGRRTEADAILGEILRLAEALGVHMPQTQAAYDEITELESARRLSTRPNR